MKAYLDAARDFEDMLDRARDFTTEETFLIGVRLLSGALDPDMAGRAYSALAQAVVGALLTRVGDAFATDHGRAPGARVAVLAMGKLGSREMTAASDLDLIVLYDFPAETAESDGRRPLSAELYYARLTQRLVAALTAPTKAGKLYDVDMRLRPSGRKGPLATRFSAFAHYQAGEAETWEHMALTRARVVAGDASLAAEVEALVRATLARPRKAETLAREVKAMRGLIAREKGDGDPWDLKLADGGLMDIEFAAQYLTLAHAGEHPELMNVSTRATLAKARDLGLIDAEAAAQLIDAHKLYTDATQIMRLTVAGAFTPDEAASGVKRRIAAAAAVPDFESLTAAIRDARAGVKAAARRVFSRRPAARRPSSVRTRRHDEGGGLDLETAVGLDAEMPHHLVGRPALQRANGRSVDRRGPGSGDPAREFEAKLSQRQTIEREARTGQGGHEFGDAVAAHMRGVAQQLDGLQMGVEHP